MQAAVMGPPGIDEMQPNGTRSGRSNISLFLHTFKTAVKKGRHSLTRSESSPVPAVRCRSRPVAANC